ncbi:MAG: alpha/beta hydrolase, partial [Thermoleophilia bacterium]
FAVRGRGLGAHVHGRIWSPANATEPLPLLVAHDGPEYDKLAFLTRYAGAMIAAGTLRRHRVALLSPGPRDEWYSASALYSRALYVDVIPALREAVPVDGLPVGMGASLGALAMLVTQRRAPGTFGALFLQSGSFFMPRFDSQESAFPRYGRIVRVVRRILRSRAHPDPVPVQLTCGTAEENVFNNRLMARALAEQGYDARLDEVPDMHNYTGWRDAFDPHLTRLLARMWNPPTR